MEEKRFTISDIEQLVLKANKKQRGGGGCLCSRDETCGVCDGSQSRELDRILKILKGELL